MAGSKEGAAKGVATKRDKYGAEHFATVGARGGKKSLGRKHSAETKRKISESKRRKNQEASGENSNEEL
jgi:hypothetical protein